MIKMIYPSNSFLGKTSPVIYEYLLYGFKQICKVEIDPKINYESKNYVEPNNPNHYTIFYIEYNNKRYRIIYDWSDFHHYHPEIRQKDDFYFKIHFTKELYNEPRVYPIGQTVGNMDYIYNLEYLRLIVDECNNKKLYENDLVCIYRTTNYDIRLKAVEILKNSNLNVKLGLKDFNPGIVRPYAPKEFKTNNLIPYMQHIKMQAKSKYILALPAVDNSRAWRHTEAWGLGVPLLALNLKSITPSLAYNDYICINNDLSNLIERINYYNKFQDVRLSIASNGKKYFDKFLSPKAMANNIISTIKESIYG